MGSLSERERDCVERFYALLEKRLGERLVEVRMSDGSPVNSDIELLVVTRDDASNVEQEELIDETYPMFLECGRQISPHFFSQRRLAAPADDERTREFLKRISADAVVDWPARPGSSARASAT